MRTSGKQLLEIVRQIRGLPVLVVGDLILDRYVWGEVDRISPEAPVPIVEVSRVEDRLGGAANVVRNLANLGADVSICGFVGDDPEAQIVFSLLERERCNKDGVIVDRSRPTILKTRIMAQRQQVLRIDREDRRSDVGALREALAAVVDSHLESSRAVVISDYGKGAISEPVMRKVEAAHAAGRLGLRTRPCMLDPHPRNFQLYRHVGIAKPNRKEAEAATGLKIASIADAREAGRKLLQAWQAEMLVLSLGEDGLLLLEQGKPEAAHIETVAREVFDVSGAGDTVTAVVAAALAVGADPIAAGELANVGAGIVVSEIGTATVTPEKFERAIAQLGG